LPRLQEEDIQNQIVSSNGLLNEIDELSLDNSNKDQIAPNPKLIDEVQDGKEKLDFLQKILKQKQNLLLDSPLDRY
jgi:Asp-tRNA(Asn)/Glu-tRNA(Gln) amidotransferase B subunit